MVQAVQQCQIAMAVPPSVPPRTCCGTLWYRSPARALTEVRPLHATLVSTHPELLVRNACHALFAAPSGCTLLHYLLLIGMHLLTIFALAVCVSSSYCAQSSSLPTQLVVECVVVVVVVEKEVTPANC